jgi:hypothetical protein
MEMMLIIYFGPLYYFPPYSYRKFLYKAYVRAHPL